MARRDPNKGIEPPMCAVECRCQELKGRSVSRNDPLNVQASLPSLDLIAIPKRASAMKRRTLLPVSRKVSCASSHRSSFSASSDGTSSEHPNAGCSA